MSPYPSVVLKMRFKENPATMKTITPMIERITPVWLCAAIDPPIENKQRNVSIANKKEMKFLQGI